MKERSECRSLSSVRKTNENFASQVRIMARRVDRLDPPLLPPSCSISVIDCSMDGRGTYLSHRPRPRTPPTSIGACTYIGRPQNCRTLLTPFSHCHLPLSAYFVPFVCFLRTLPPSEDVICATQAQQQVIAARAHYDRGSYGVDVSSSSERTTQPDYR